MNIQMTEKAVDWYKKEYEIDEGTFRFFVRYGGIGGNVPGFSLGVNLEQPSSVHASINVDDMTFFVEESDAWYFEDRDLVISLNEALNEPQFAYQ